MKIGFGDVLVLAGFVAMGVGLWMLEWRWALVVMGCLLMAGGGLILRKGTDEPTESDI